MSRRIFLMWMITSTLSGVLLAHTGESQKLLSDYKVILTPGVKTLSNVLTEIETQTDFTFTYFDELDEKIEVRVDARKKRLDKVLELIAEKKDLHFKRVNNLISVRKKLVVKLSNGLLKEKSLDYVIKGKVLDERGNGLPGASVVVTGTTIGAITDIDGNYTLRVPEDATTLTFSFIGYTSFKEEISGRTEVNVTMNPDIAQLQEVVVIGYGNVERRDLTGTVSTIKAKDMEALPVNINIDQALQGQAAGVYVVQESGQPGSAARVRIRGSTSLLGSNQPLYVIDGIPVVATSNIPSNANNLNGELLNEGVNSPLGNINTSDIESVNILKDASATAIYGSRAANGVIIITTKRGGEGQKPIFNANFSVNRGEAQTVDLLNAEQFRGVWTEAVVNSGSTNGFAQSVLDSTYFGDADTNWEDEVSVTNPVTTNFNLSASGGSKNTKYYVGLGIRDQDGVFENSAFERYSLNLNLDTELSDALTIGTSISLSHSNQIIPDPGLLNTINRFRPDVPVFDENGDYFVSGTFREQNPVALSTAKTENVTSLLLGSVYGQLDIFEGLYFKSFLSFNYNAGNRESFYPSHTGQGGLNTITGALGSGYAVHGNSDLLSHVWENTVHYDRQLDKHLFNAVLGVSWQGDQSSYLEASGEGFPQDDVLTNLGSATSDFLIDSYESENGLTSYFGRVNYTYDDRYYITLAGRVDGSSKFADNNKWAFFPTAALAWRISSEEFMSGARIFDDLKLRASIGVTGQQDFGDYQWRTLFESSTYGGLPAVVQNQLGNSDLKWETSQQFDLGLDFSMLSGRLSGSVVYYQKSTNDLLYFANIPRNAGFTRVISNLGDTENEGIELELTADIIRSENFGWQLSGNISRNRNRLTSINDDFLDEDTNTINPPNTGSRLKVGEPIGLIFGYVADGIFQEQSEIDALNASAPDGSYQRDGTAPGDLRFLDINGPDGIPDGEVNAFDQTIIGDTQADWFGGFTNTLTYKGLTLTALFTYSIGNDLFWESQRVGITFASAFASENKIAEVLNNWTAENPTDQPRSVFLDPNDNDRFSSYYVHDASYLRLKNISLSYQLPASILKRTKFINTCVFHVSATNLLTFTNYPGADPETNNLFNNDVSSGRDNNRFPQARLYSGGVRISF
ncbi:TonB-dependent receptor [Fulvivirga sp. M361]|uniref:SusC/RagA family TonB-linked outer membrane protein n=1 Tax=Fulvivirga sp. M361 TaxID=2594266 RepID=UPI001C88C0BD|nr:TonB-dependent receptor [Fulvivirga sp. M361]